jgi:4'-phosphopantetheinyl transferase
MSELRKIHSSREQLLPSLRQAYTMSCQWPSAEKVLLPGSQHVDVWCVELDSAQILNENYLGILDEAEKGRAARYHYESDRNKFILRRGVLRQLLGKYLNALPSQIQYTTNEFGKPALDQRIGSDLQFNLSTSGDTALLAFTEGRRVGVDIERERKDFETGSIANRFFSAAEQASLSQLPPGQRLQGFYNCWTRKEAVIKALGQGLSIPLDSFDVNLAPGEPARVLAARDAALGILQMKLQELEPSNGYKAALAVEGGDWKANCWRYEEIGA